MGEKNARNKARDEAVAGLLLAVEGETSKARGTRLREERLARQAAPEEEAPATSAARDAHVFTAAQQPTAGWIVSGAGDENYDGEYSEAGTHNDKAYYSKAAPARYLYFSLSGPGWMLNTGLGAGDPAYVGAAYLPGTFVVWSGDAPAPTLAAAEATSAEKRALDADQVARLARMAPVHLGRAPERVTRLPAGRPVEVQARQPDFEEVQAPGQPFPTRVWREAAVAHKLRPG